jgi:lysophospholipase L1-like esterase
MSLLTGDSLAVGISAFLHVPVDARVGRTSRQGLVHIQHSDASVLYVSLGANDPDDPTPFRRRVRLALQGRRCVAWVQVPRRPRLNRVLATTKGVRVVRLTGIHRGDGVHPDGAGYRLLAKRLRRACP